MGRDPGTRLIVPEVHGYYGRRHGS